MEVIGLFITFNLPKILVGVIILGLSVWLSAKLSTQPFLRGLIVVLVQIAFFEYSLSLSISRWDSTGGFYCSIPVVIYSLIVGYFIYSGGPCLLDEALQSKGKIMIGIGSVLMVIGLIGIDIVIAFLNYH